MALTKTPIINKQLDTMNGLLAAMVRQGYDSSNIDWKQMEDYAHDGVFGDIFAIGDQFVDTWTDTVTGTAYSYPWQLNDVRDIELADGETLKNRPLLQCHYAHPFGVQFSHQRAFLACPDGLAAGTYYFTIESTWGSNVKAGDVVCFTTTKDVPAGGRISGCYGAPDQSKSNWRIYTHSADGKTVLETLVPTFTASGTNLGVQKYNSRNGNINSLQEMAYGWNRWSKSALRQYLNSDASVGGWWTAQDEWDIAPNELTTKAGFLSGVSDELKEIIKPIKITTYTNTAQDGGGADVTYDKVWLPSLQEMHVNPQIAGEGEVHEYWLRKSASATPLAQYGTYPNMIAYAVENHTSPQHVRLRSAYRGLADNTWCVYSSGNVNDVGAGSSNRFSPLVAI